MSIARRIPRDNKSSRNASESEESQDLDLTSSELEIAKALDLDFEKIGIIRSMGISLDQFKQLVQVLGVLQGGNIPLDQAGVITKH